MYEQWTGNKLNSDAIHTAWKTVINSIKYRKFANEKNGGIRKKCTNRTVTKHQTLTSASSVPSLSPPTDGDILLVYNYLNMQ